MIRMPDVLGLILCQRMHVDPVAGKTSLVGLFGARRFKMYPTPPQSFTVYSVLYDGEGEGTMELVLTRLEDEKDAHVKRWWQRLPGRDYLVNLEIKVENCIIPSPGRYMLCLYFDRTQLSSRIMNFFLD